jgi:hypothetical protein
VTKAVPYGDGTYMRWPNFSSVGAVLGSAAGGFEVVKPPRLGLGRMAVLELGLPAVMLGVVSVLSALMNWSLV